MTLNGLFCANVPLRNYSLTHGPFSIRFVLELRRFYENGNVK